MLFATDRSASNSSQKMLLNSRENFAKCHAGVWYYLICYLSTFRNNNASDVWATTIPIIVVGFTSDFHQPQLFHRPWHDNHCYRACKDTYNTFGKNHQITNFVFQKFFWNIFHKRTEKDPHKREGDNFSRNILFLATLISFAARRNKRLQTHVKDILKRPRCKSRETFWQRSYFRTKYAHYMRKPHSFFETNFSDMYRKKIHLNTLIKIYIYIPPRFFISS